MEAFTGVGTGMSKALKTMRESMRQAIISSAHASGSAPEIKET